MGPGPPDSSAFFLFVEDGCPNSSHSDDVPGSREEEEEHRRHAPPFTTPSRSLSGQPLPDYQLATALTEPCLTPHPNLMKGL